MIKKLQTPSNLRQKVFEAVRDFVINGGVAPGGKIDEAYLAESLGVSKTPVREALSILATEGIVEIKPNRGSFKVRLTAKDIEEIGMIRGSLEGLCMRLACRKMTPRVIQKLKALIQDFEDKDFEKEYSAFVETNVKFHELIHKTAKSPRLVSLIQSNRDMAQMFRLKYFFPAIL